MSEYDDFPGVVVNTDDDALTPTAPEHIFAHLDEYEEVSISPPDAKTLHIYAFEREGRRDELLRVQEELEQDYIFSTILVWPDWVEDRADGFSTEMFKALEWVIALGHRPHPDDVEVIREFL
jgi:hypothetical protein